MNGWEAKLKSAYSFMLKYSKITVCAVCCGKSKFLPMNYTYRLFLGLTESPTTYNVKCLHESGPNSIIYRASFFTSEVDKVNRGYRELLDGRLRGQIVTI